MEKKEQKKHKKPRSKILILFVIFWVAIIGVSFAVVSHQAGQYNTLRAEAERIQAHIDELTAQNQGLYDQITFFDSDLYIEARARERLGMVRPTEIVFRNISAVD